MHVYLHIAMAACYIICYNLNVVVSVSKNNVYYLSVNCLCLQVSGILLASYPGLLTPAFVACSTNVGEGLVKLSHVQ